MSSCYRDFRKSDDSFCQKLSDGSNINILIVGDSIGAGDGASDNSTKWSSLLQKYLEDTYKSEIYITNVSMRGNTSYAGYIRTMTLDDDRNYDLAIICYGQNDSPENFSLYYESIIRAIKNKYNHCSIISILESSQKDWRVKNSFQNLIFTSISVVAENLIFQQQLNH